MPQTSHSPGIFARAGWVLPILILLASALLPAHASAAQSEGSTATIAPDRHPALAPPGNSEHTLQFGGRERRYIVHIPPFYDGAAPPLVIGLHGGGSNPGTFIAYTGMSAAADERGMIAVYPFGTARQAGSHNLTWNAGNCCAYALEHDVDDAGFIKALIAVMRVDYGVDPKRVYVTGHSNGGMLAYLLGCRLADEIAAIAPVAGALNVDCDPAAPVAVQAFHGTADPLVSYYGGYKPAALPPRRDNSVAYAMRFWSSRDGCDTAPQSTTVGHIRHDVYAGCAPGTTVELYSVIGGGHGWPGGRFADGGVMREISATSLMLDFFLAHPRP